MIWDLATVMRVEGLWVQLDIDQTVIDQAGDVAIEATKQRLACGLINEAHALAVEIDPRDVVFDEARRPPERGFGVTIRASWRPATNEIELVGGESDGRVVVWPHLTDTFRVPVLSDVTLAGEPPTPTIPVLDYKLAGWSETHRRWVYRLS